MKRIFDQIITKTEIWQILMSVLYLKYMEHICSRVKIYSKSIRNIRDNGSSTSLFFMNGSNLGRFYDNSCDVSGHDTIDISNANSVSLLYSLLLFMFLYFQWKFTLAYDIWQNLRYMSVYLWNIFKVIFIGRVNICLDYILIEL